MESERYGRFAKWEKTAVVIFVAVAFLRIQQLIALIAIG
jgi:hypothetical protein